MSYFVDDYDHPRVGRIVGAIVTGLFLLFVGMPVVFGSWTVVDPGFRGVRVTLGNVSQDIVDQGFTFKLPYISSVHKISIQTQTTKFDNEKGAGDDTEHSSLFAASKDLQDVQVATVVNWHVDPNKVIDVYQQYQGLDNFTASIVAPIVRDTIKANSAKFTAEELVQKREEFAQTVAKDLETKLAEKGALFERVNIVNFEFSQAFTSAIEAKVVAEQNALAAKNKLEQVKYEAEQRIAQANGEAEAIKIQAQAITQQGGADYVKLQWIKAWDGKLPSTMLGDSQALINIK